MTSSNDLALNEGTKKFKRGEIAENNLDVLSNLPEVLTSHILSFLSTKDAVRTSVLSKCWEYRWTNVINLSFDDQLLYGSGERNRTENFMSFVDRVLLLLCNPVIESFTLRGMDHYAASRVHAWISTALRRDVQKLVIYCSVNELLVFPECIYDTTSLIEMDLRMICIFKVPTNVCFSSLNILHLSKVRFLNCRFPQSTELNLSFPKLQEIKLHRCRWKQVTYINIDAPELTICTIADDERDRERMDVEICADLTIDAPKLCKFLCDFYLAQHIIFVNPSSIVDATIELYSNFREYEAMVGLVAGYLLQQLCGLKHLTLSRRTVMALRYDDGLGDILPTLNFPLHLTVTWGIPTVDALVILFKGLPGLLSLTFSKGNPDGPPQGYLRRCSLPNLKVVKILSFSGTGAELELAKFILLNATALEEMIITSNENLRMDTEQRLEAEAVSKELQRVQWASSRVSVTLRINARLEE